MDTVPDLDKARRYVAAGAFGCPFCDDESGEQRYENDYTDGDLRGCSCHCPICGNSWQEVYWLAYIHEVHGSEAQWEVRKDWANEEDDVEFVEEVVKNAEGKVIYG